MPTPSLWLAETERRHYPGLDADLVVDVCVIGGGIAGATAAWHLRKNGHSVSLLERNRIACVDTGHTTAHLTQVTDARLSDLVSRFGRDHARAAWDAGRAAIESIHEATHAANIDCDFTWVPGWLHARRDAEDMKREVEELREEARLATAFGFDARFEHSTPLMETPGIRFARQARFHPVKYVDGLIRAAAEAGARIFEQSDVTEITENPLTVHANGRSIRCGHLVIATHSPLQGVKNLLGATLFQSKMAAYSSYVISARVPAGAVPDALFWDTGSPYRYLRLSGDQVVFGGEDHKTGQMEDGPAPYERLESALRAILPGAPITRRWTGQVIEPHDELPYIGEIADKQFIATGFAGNGMTFGTLGGMMACDHICGRRNPWATLFDPMRKTLSTTWDYVKENLDYPYYMVRDRLTRAEGTSLEDVGPGEGKLLRLNGDRVAAYRDPSGGITTMSPVCPHMGCLVHWNATDATWDCPCHGSRFHPTGDVLAGPAESGLPMVKADTVTSSRPQP